MIIVVPAIGQRVWMEGMGRGGVVRHFRIESVGGGKPPGSLMLSIGVQTGPRSDDIEHFGPQIIRNIDHEPAYVEISFR